MANYTKWQRMRAAGQAAAVTGELIITASTAPLPPQPATDVGRSDAVPTTPATVAAPTIRPTEDLILEAAKWQKLRIEAERTRELDVGRAQRQPDRGEERRR